jgi:RimJ/RimL family protein N-acetyltransferase
MHAGTQMNQPTLGTARLLLRPFVPADAGRIAELAGTREVADTTVSIPHPYPISTAEQWIASHANAWLEDRAAHFAISLLPHGPLIGGISLRDIQREHYQAELGIWIGKPWWGNGYASEAVEALLHLAFDQLGLNRVHAHHLNRNRASGHLLERAGFRREGLLRQRVMKWGRFEDVVLLSILRAEWLVRQSTPA